MTEPLASEIDVDGSAAPVNYTAANVALTAHLAGIDVALGSADEFDAYDAAGLTDVSTALATTVPLGTTRTNTGTAFTLASNEVTVTDAGLYEIAPRMSVAADGALGAYVQLAWIEVDAVEIGGSRMYCGAE